MSGVRAAVSLNAQPRRQPPADVTAMQDQLYEILAAGVGPSETAPLEAIESFLHEHARSPKSHEEFAAFFTRHGLTVLPTALPPPEGGAFTLPAVSELGESGEPTGLAFASTPAAAPRAVPPPPPPLHLSFDDELPRMPVGPRPLWLWGALAVTGAALAALLWVGFGMLEELRAEVRHARARAAQQEQVIGALQGQAAGIESSVAANGELIQRMDQKSDLLLRSLAPADGHGTRRDR